MTFTYHRPTSLDEAVSALQQGPQPAVVLAGGTDLLVRYKLEGSQFGAVVSLRDIEGLGEIEADDDGVTLGARVTLAEVLESDLLAQRVPLLVDAARRMANTNIRNRATVLGNICNASPAADTAGPLLVLGAKVAVVGPDGERWVDVADWFTGPRQCCLAENEIARSLVIPNQAGAGRFERLANRRNADLALASSCLLLTLADDGTVTDARISLGAVAATPLRSAAAEAVLVGAKLDADTIAAAAKAAASDARPIDDVRATAWYRTEMVHNLTRRGLEALAGGAA